MLLPPPCPDCILAGISSVQQYPAGCCSVQNGPPGMVVAGVRRLGMTVIVIFSAGEPGSENRQSGAWTALSRRREERAWVEGRSEQS